jgi:hypothetical protein
MKLKQLILNTEGKFMLIFERSKPGRQASAQVPNTQTEQAFCIPGSIVPNHLHIMLAGACSELE